MSLQNSLAFVAMKAQNMIYCLSFPSISDIVDGGSAALQDGGVFSDASAKVDELGGGASNVTYKVAIWLFIIGLIVAAIALFFSNGGNRSENKSNIVIKIIAVVLACTAVGIITFFATVGGGLF